MGFQRQLPTSCFAWAGRAVCTLLSPPVMREDLQDPGCRLTASPPTPVSHRKGAHYNPNHSLFFQLMVGLSFHFSKSFHMELCR